MPACKQIWSSMCGMIVQSNAVVVLSVMTAELVVAGLPTISLWWDVLGEFVVDVIVDTIVLIVELTVVRFWVDVVGWWGPWPSSGVASFIMVCVVGLDVTNKVVADVTTIADVGVWLLPFPGWLVVWIELFVVLLGVVGVVAVENGFALEQDFCGHL